MSSRTGPGRPARANAKAAASSSGSSASSRDAPGRLGDRRRHRHDVGLLEAPLADWPVAAQLGG